MSKSLDQDSASGKPRPLPRVNYKSILETISYLVKKLMIKRFHGTDWVTDLEGGWGYRSILRVRLKVKDLDRG